MGDRASLDALLERTQGWLHRYVLRLVGDADLALEVVQEVFVSICRKLTFLRNPDLFRPWVYRIASREAFRHLRRRRRRASRERPVVDEIAAEPPRHLDPAVRRALRRGVSRLPPKTRAVFLLHYFEELSLREAADVLGLAPGTVKSRLAYGLRLLRQRFGKESELEIT